MRVIPDQRRIAVELAGLAARTLESPYRSSRFRYFEQRRIAGDDDHAGRRPTSTIERSRRCPDELWRRAVDGDLVELVAANEGDPLAIG